MSDGIAIVLTLVAIGGFAWFMEWIGEGWHEMQQPLPSGSAVADEARIPELAAARRPPSYPGRCRCAACRRFGRAAPCSDYDGD